MKKIERKIIFECRVGSHLYGTNRPDSDEDFLGVFLPSTEDMLSLGNPPSEWTMNSKQSDGPRNTKGDVDRKYFSLQKFLNLLGQGQSGPIELLFAPDEMKTVVTPEWELILKNKQIFLSASSVLPFIGFAQAQAHKAVLKGENLSLIRRLIEKIPESDRHKPLNNYLMERLDNGKILAFGETLDFETGEDGIGQLKIAGRRYQVTSTLGMLLKGLKELERKYGTRSEAAAANKYDFKSLSHAYRLLGEARELLQTGAISFPVKNAEFLKEIKEGKYIADFFKEIEDSLTELRRIKTLLPPSVNWGKINSLCQEMLYKHLFEE